MELHVERWGSGPPVVLVHGSVTNGAMTWPEQRPLANSWTITVVDRRGYFPNPPVEREDFEVDARDLEAFLDDGVHLVGHSYGGVVCLLAAAARPDAVRSLTVVEPPAFGVARGDPDVESFIERTVRHWQTGPSDPEGFLAGFLDLVGSRSRFPTPLPAPLEQNTRLLMVERAPWEAVIPLADLAAAGFPKLVVSGGHSRAFDAVCDVLEDRLGAERAVIPGARHSVPRVGKPFNDRLEAFLDASRARSTTFSTSRS